MKILKTTFTAAAILGLLLSFTACKKGKNDPSGSGAGYKYNSKTYIIDVANEKHINGDIFLEFTSGNTGNYLQVSFANVIQLPQGTTTYHADRFNGYNPASNFWVSGIGLAGDNIAATGGTVTITKSGGSYQIDFNISTANGAVTGSYTGTPIVTT
jgi:hypothetical protein